MRTLPDDAHRVVVHRTHLVRGRIMFSGTCTCGATSGVVTTSGMVSGWHANHREEVASCDA